MKKFIAALLAAALCAGLACPALASGFVSSIGAKPAPEVGGAVLEEEGKKTEDVTICVVVTSISQANNKETDVHQESRDLLLEVYAQIRDGEADLPIGSDYVVRELVSVDLSAEECVGEDHGHDEAMEKVTTAITVTFQLGLDGSVEVVVLVYSAGSWQQVAAQNNGDGTVTCVLEELGPVAFCVKAEEEEIVSPGTGDNGVVRWAALFILSVAALAALPALRRREDR